MALIRAVRIPPFRPSGDKLRRLMADYGITRKTVARLMRCSRATVNSYLLPSNAKGWHAIPLGRFELILLKVQAVYHPDEMIDLPL